MLVAVACSPAPSANPPAAPQPAATEAKPAEAMPTEALAAAEPTAAPAAEGGYRHKRNRHRSARSGRRRRPNFRDRARDLRPATKSTRNSSPVPPVR